MPRYDHQSITAMIAEADDHVQRVQTGHHEVEREEDLRVAEMSSPRTETPDPGTWCSTNSV